MQDPSPVEPRGLEGGEETGVPSVPGRRLDAAAQAATEAAGSDVSAGAIPSDRTIARYRWLRNPFLPNLLGSSKPFFYC